MSLRARRSCSLALAGLLVIAGCGRPLLERIAYGPNAADSARMLEIGPDAYIEEQLHPERIDDAAFEARLVGRTTLELPAGTVVRTYGATGSDMPEVPLLEVVDAKILRAAYSKRQLEALLTEFWVNHFHVRDSGLTLGAFEHETIRPNVLGRFEDLLRAVARSPAMAIYLDNVMNVRDGVVMDGVVRGTNENYARELLELHTVGVDAGYDQQDVIDLARCFTGWSIDWDAPDGFVYVDQLHDKGAKNVMGLVLAAGGGESDGRSAIAYLASHPSTARHIATKLVRRFVDEDAPAALVDAVTDTYLATDGDLREVMRTILDSAEIQRGARSRSKVKRPLVLVASTIRALGLDVQDDLARYRDFLLMLGEYPYAATDPRGYPENSAHWVAPDTLLVRLEFIRSTILRAQSAGIGFDADGSETSAELVTRLSQRLGLRALSKAERAPIETFAESMLPASHAVRVGEVASVLLSTTRFLKH